MKIRAQLIDYVFNRINNQCGASEFSIQPRIVVRLFSVKLATFSLEHLAMGNFIDIAEDMANPRGSVGV